MSDQATALRRAGARDLLICELRNMADGCMGSDRLRQEAREGADLLASGEWSVSVGHFVYEVAEN